MRTREITSIIDGMKLQIDKDAAAFGLFQLVYAALDERLGGAVLDLARANGERCSESEVRSKAFGKKVEVLKEAIKPLKSVGRRDLLSQDLAEMAKAFQKIGEVQRWRKDRAHARVVFASNLVLVDEKGKPLPITYGDCVKQIEKARDAIIALEVNTRNLATYLQVRRGVADALIEN